MTPEAASKLRHDLRTPLNHITGYTELMLEEDGLPAAVAEALSAVRVGAQETLAAVAAMLEHGETGAGFGTLHAAAESLAAAVARAESVATPAIQSDTDRVATAARQLQAMIARLREPGPAAVAPSEQAPGAETVLVVDDDAANRDVLGRRLARLGYRGVEASDGATALERMRRDAIDLVLLDIMMPGLDGYAVLRERHGDAALRDIPVVMISALDETEGVARCIELGAEDYLSKPFDPVLLKARVGASIEKKKLHDREKALLLQVTEQAARLQEWNAELERRVAEQVRQVERLSLMERFVAPQLAEVIAAGGAELLASHRREIAVLFCDLRGFTSFAETAEPEEVMSVLRELHEAVGPRIFEHGGTLAQFTGDGMMVFFNDPLPCDEPAWRAVRLGLDMTEAAAALSEEWRGRGHHLALGAGIALGYATCGLVGFEGRYEYTAIGTVTNLAARLCAEARGGQVLASERVRAAIGERAAVTPIGELALKGFARPVAAYEVGRTTEEPS